MLSKEEIEKFIQEMTEVRPDKLNKEALRLYNTIMQILDKNEQLETNNQKVVDKLEELEKELKMDGYNMYASDVGKIIKIAKGEK